MFVQQEITDQCNGGGGNLRHHIMGYHQQQQPKAECVNGKANAGGNYEFGQRFRVTLVTGKGKTIVEPVVDERGDGERNGRRRDLGH